MILFIDDERFPPSDGRNWVIARTLYETHLAIEKHGFPTFVSFDHDLGENQPTGYDIAKELVEIDMLNHSMPENFDFYVHSQNPIGKKNIEMYLKNYLEFKHGQKN